MPFRYTLRPFHCPLSVSAMSEKPARTTVLIDLRGQKDAWVAWCARQGLSQADALRGIVSQLTERDAQVQSAPLRHSVGPAERGAKRLTLRLTSSELQAAGERADREGLTPSRWVVALVRFALTQEPQLSSAELLELRRSNAALQAIGRNLNQVAKGLNISPNERLLFKADLIETIDKSVKAHTETVAKVLAANVQRWRLQ